MPTFRSGEMFRASGFIIVTGNSFLTSEVKLVMGRGAALQLKRKEPGIDLVFGEKIHKTCGHLGFYGLIFHKRYGLAQVKCRFNERARVGLIRISMRMLGSAARRDRNTIFNVNFPGIGNGGLKKHQVESLLKESRITSMCGKKKEVWSIAYTPILSQKASCTLRRITWALGVPMTKAMEMVFEHVPLIVDKKKVCEGCRDKTGCGECAFNE